MKIKTKRVISMIIAFLIGIIIALFGWSILHEEGLTDEELIEIALNDSRVRGEIGNWSYEIGNVSTQELENHVQGVYPVIPIYLGNHNKTGVTLVVFIDEEKRSVIYIGYDYRRVELPY